MVYFHSSISSCNSKVGQSAPQSMANSIDFGSKSRNRKTQNPSNSLQIPPCHRSRSAVVDVVIFVAVIAALAILFFPYIKISITESIRFSGMIMDMVKEEASFYPWIYVSIGVSVICFALTIWLVVDYTTRKCGNPNCKGLRNAPEFDIQLETEDTVRNSSSPSVAKDGGGVVKKGLFKLPCEHNRELEAELKKLAPPNGRAVLVLMAKCGCSVGRLDVPGPKKNWKIKKKDAAKD